MADATSSDTLVNVSDQQKRRDYLGWEEYFMGIALLSSKRSKDPRTQVGACIVSEDNIIMGTGYNGIPKGCSDDAMPWGNRREDGLNNKHFYVCHAELNAVINKNSSDIKGCNIFVTLFPCNQCAKILIQSGIKEVVYLSDKYSQRDDTKAAKQMFDKVGIKYRKYLPERSEVLISYNTEDSGITEPNKMHSERAKRSTPCDQSLK